MNSIPAEVQALLDKQAIYEAIVRYCRGLDRCDADLAKSAWHADAIYEHGGHYNGNAHEFCDYAMPFLKPFGPMSHMTCQVHVELKGDLAHVESYGLAYQRLVKDGQPFDCVVGARLLDKFAKRNGEWKIAHRRAILDWNNDIPNVESWGKGLYGHFDPVAYGGRKDKTDPSYIW
jgi:hypothetical protein